MSALRLQLATLAAATLLNPLSAGAQSNNMNKDMGSAPTDMSVRAGYRGAEQMQTFGETTGNSITLETVTVTGQKITPLIASCDMKDGSAALPATSSVARDQLGIHACIEGDFEKIFAVPGGTRRTYFNQMVHAYSEISNGLREGRAATNGPLNFVNNMDVTYIPDNNAQQVRYNFSWMVRRPVAEVTLENALPNSDRRGDYIYTELNGIIAVPLVGPAKKADFKPQ